jgi:arginine deiminase
MTSSVSPDDFRIRVASEVDFLRGVVVHRPDASIELVTPDNMGELLFEDIVDLPRLQEEHDLMVGVLGSFLRLDQIFEFQDLLFDILAIPEARLAILARLAEDTPGVDIVNLGNGLENNELAELLLTGMDGVVRYLPPIPNLIFTRDIAAVVGDLIIPSLPAKPARAREAILAAFVFRHHPLFATYRDKIVIPPPDILAANKGSFTLEGGDIMVWGPGHVLIGVGERTTLKAARWLRKYLLQEKVAERVTIIASPSGRFNMHIDTVMTRISQTEAVVFAPLVMRTGSGSGNIWIEDGFLGADDSVLIHSVPSLEDLIKSTEVTDLILCGGGVFTHDVREQWSDGCNWLAIRPGLVVGYERNRRTAQALAECGYKIVSAEQLLTDHCNRYADAGFQPDVKMAILISSSELTRGRGGPHCMMLPLSRASREEEPRRDNTKKEVTQSDDPVGLLTRH